MWISRLALAIEFTEGKYHSVFSEISVAENNSPTAGQASSVTRPLLPWLTLRAKPGRLQKQFTSFHNPLVVLASKNYSPGDRQ